MTEYLCPSCDGDGVDYTDDGGSLCPVCDHSGVIYASEYFQCTHLCQIIVTGETLNEMHRDRVRCQCNQLASSFERVKAEEVDPAWVTDFSDLRGGA